MRAFSIVPPGQEGNVSDTELATGSFGAHYDDQLDMYAQLVNDDVTEGELSKYFHSMQFGPQGDVEREYSRIEGATVYRDELGIPHIYVDALDKAGFALGYGVQRRRERVHRRAEDGSRGRTRLPRRIQGDPRALPRLAGGVGTRRHAVGRRASAQGLR